ncbi:Negative regulator of beta-lactamase expression [Candidatus Syntrophocurvum alkaliphilum]|uniref:N-acetylmuramoyl-L-alanine amidase n=1 Tax=Candidatus Syntrophocurvum alkaliphilum TaxID=2293317 RepID=A0A6I6DH69_9FIRM|nr:peptidoglycan recognition family protein [Candidatus Syntrophocurvum alkaliphilum]QGU00153.1 Negative regulator of beta-lactamase expression [Candidatus Syntrophocurvum alkaliphilum]
MAEFKIEWVGTPNYRKGRNGRKPIAIVNHITDGLYPGTLHWMQNPNARVSSHYLVTKDGEIFQLVKDEDTAFTNGVVNQPSWILYDGTNPNAYTLTIEHEALAGESLTEKQYQATLWLHNKLIDKWEIPVTRDHIIGHYRIDSVNRPNCPGENFSWDRLFNDLKKGEDNVSVPEWKVNIMKEASEIGLIDIKQHEPDEPASKWFVLGVVLNFIKILRKSLGEK